MSEGKLDPKSLSAEERAIVEEMVTRCGTHWGYTGVAVPFGHGQTEEFAGWLQDGEYAEAYAAAFRRILARRAIFGGAEGEGAKVECPNCGEKTSENHEVVQSDGLEGGRRLFFYTCQQRINELEDRHNRMASLEYQEKVKADMARRAVEIGVDRLVGISAFPVGNCPTCGDLVAPWNKHAKYEGGYTCEPAQPEPTTADRIAADLAAGTFRGVRPEPAAPKGMAGVCFSIEGERWHEPGTCPHCTAPAAPVGVPEALQNAVRTLVDLSSYAWRPERQVMSTRAREAADDIADWWRAYSQPAPVGNEDCVRAKSEGPWLNEVLKPAAPEMPEAVGTISAARKYAVELDHPTSMEFYIRVDGFMAGAKHERAHSQPAPVRMTPELERVLTQAESAIAPFKDHGLIADIAAVRAQAAEARAVKLPKAREVVSLLLWKIENGQGDRSIRLWLEMLRPALAEIDAAERGE